MFESRRSSAGDMSIYSALSKSSISRVVAAVAKVRGMISMRKGSEDGIEAISGSGLFDARWYKGQLSERLSTLTKDEAVAHYIATGASQGLQPNSLFDPSLYYKKHPEIRRSGANPLLHFLRAGGLNDVEKIEKSGLFDLSWYFSQLPIQSNARPNLRQAIAHYILAGHESKLTPNPLFDKVREGRSNAQQSTNPLLDFLSGSEMVHLKLIAESNLFDQTWYLQQIGRPDVSATKKTIAIAHYLYLGAEAGLDPHPLFDTDWYAETYEDVSRERMNPLAHFLLRGRAEGRSGGIRHQQAKLIAKSGLFDTRWYQEQVMQDHNETITEARAIAHYLADGAGNPNRLFDSAGYAKKHVHGAGDVPPLVHFLMGKGPKHARIIKASGLFDFAWYLRQLGIDDASLITEDQAIVHYLIDGNLEPNPAFSTQAYFAANPDAPRGENPLVQFIVGPEFKFIEIIEKSEVFDLQWYLEQLGLQNELMPTLTQAVAHYLCIGANIGLNPNPYFDTNWYLAKNRDVAGARRNPLAHYLSSGERERRDPGPAFNIEYYLKTYPDVEFSRASPLRHFIKHGAKEGRKPTLGAARPQLAARLEDITSRMLPGDGTILEKRTFTLRPLAEVAEEKGWPTVVLDPRSAFTYHDIPPADRQIQAEVAAKLPLVPKVTRATKVAIIGGTRHILPDTQTLINDEILCYYDDPEVALKGQWLERGKSEPRSIVQLLRRAPGNVIQHGIHAMHEYANNYFHLIVEALPRIVAAESLDPALPILLNGDLHDNFRSLVDIIAPRRDKIYVDPLKVYRVEDLAFVSDVSSVLDIYTRQRRSYETVLHIGLIRAAADIALSSVVDASVRPRGRRLYVRRGRRYRGLLNEAEIENALIGAGFELLSVDGLSLESQIRLFREAAIVVGPTGAALTNIVWCHNDTPVIVLAASHEAMPLEIWKQLGMVSGCSVQTVEGPRAYTRTDMYELHDDYTVPVAPILERVAALGFK